MSGEFDVEAINRLFAIDNQYLLFLLRFGWLGLLSWVAVLTLTINQLWHLSSQRMFRSSGLMPLLCAAIIGVVFIQFTVWMPQDYGFVLIWTCGLIAGIASANKFESLQVESRSSRSW
jgi:O-antigen ligase